jgi:hypothetical protein
MKRLFLTALVAAVLAAAVSAREYISTSAGAPARNAPPGQPVIEAVDQNLLALETIERLTPGTDPAAPQITFALRDRYAPAAARQDIATWQIQIFNSSAKKVGFIQGRGQPPPPALPWSGLSENGEPLPGGFYTARLVWMNGAKKLYTTQPVSFHLFSRLQMPEFAELEFDFPLSGGLSLL